MLRVYVQYTYTTIHRPQLQVKPLKCVTWPWLLYLSGLYCTINLQQIKFSGVKSDVLYLQTMTLKATLEICALASDIPNDVKTNGKLITFLHDMGNTTFLTSKLRGELKTRLPISSSLGTWGLWKEEGQTSYSYYIYAWYKHLQTWTENGPGTTPVHTQCHFKYQFYRLRVSIKLNYPLKCIDTFTHSCNYCFAALVS